ncbi:MAG: twin-arginine translocation signal domain-containing protein, partial [Thermodesulfobacteriota bacterium]
MAHINRRDFLKLTGMAGGAVLLGITKEETMAETKSRVALITTRDRKAGVRASIKALGINPAKGKAVLINPNFNTADITPGSTHNDTLVALVEEIWAMGAKTISLGERSYPLTRE